MLNSVDCLPSSATVVLCGLFLILAVAGRYGRYRYTVLIARLHSFMNVTRDIVWRVRLSVGQ